MEIRPLTRERIDDFFMYLNDHISDNGKRNSSLFLPISRENLSLSNELIQSFKRGQFISVDKLGWRRVLIAENEKNDIIGHIDIKSHNQSYTNHRAVMGMGVHSDYRRDGLGKLLIETMLGWVRTETEIERIDLWVLSGNNPAIRLYVKLGFEKVGEVEDMFRIDGASHDYIMMTKKIE